MRHMYRRVKDKPLYPKNNLNLAKKTKPVTVVADAAEHVWFLSDIVHELGLVFMRRFGLFLGYCVQKAIHVLS